MMTFSSRETISLSTTSKRCFVLWLWNLWLYANFNSSILLQSCHGFQSPKVVSLQKQHRIHHPGQQQPFEILTTLSSRASMTTSCPVVLFAAAKGFGAAPASSKKKSKAAPSAKAIAKQLTKTYGGTTPEQIARGTQQIMNSRMKQLSEPLQLLLQLYQQLQQWNFRIQGLSVLEQTKVFSPQDIQGAQRAQQELDRLLQEQSMTTTDLHNLLQVMTWDASADAKAARSITGKMSRETQQRLEKASAIIAEATGTGDGVNVGRCLDVGCGFGVMVPFLTKAGLKKSQIYGIDLSPEMIRNANKLHAGVNFASGDFFQYNPKIETTNKDDDNDGDNLLLFESIVFCSSLHDLPDMMEALKKAISLLKPGVGAKLVILHPQGASHVINQVKSNPVLVQRGLPTAGELQELEGVKLVVEPAAAKSREESRDGYLAVLERL